MIFRGPLGSDRVAGQRRLVKLDGDDGTGAHSARLAIVFHRVSILLFSGGVASM